MKAPVRFNKSAIEFKAGQYAVGVNGTNGFAIADWVGQASMSISVILEVKNPFTYNSGVFPIFYISDGDALPLTSITVGIGGPWTSAVVNEYITMSRTTGGQTYYRASTTESVSFINFFTYVYGATPAMYLNGAAVAAANQNALALATSGLTGISRLSVGGFWNGANATGNVKVKELSFINRIVTLSEHQSLYTYYGGTQRRLGTDNVSMIGHSLFKDASFCELYPGVRNGNILLAAKKSSHNLTLMGI